MTEDDNGVETEARKKEKKMIIPDDDVDENDGDDGDETEAFSI